jgi:hypothetical protein
MLDRTKKYFSRLDFLLRPVGALAPILIPLDNRNFKEFPKAQYIVVCNLL